VEVLRRRRRVDDAHVVLRAQVQEAFDARARVLGALPLVRVGEEQADTAGLPPLVLRGGDELVDDDLGAVEEVAELCLPQDERLGILHRVAVLESEGGELGQHRVVQHERRLIGRQVREGDVLLLGALIDEHAVALAERAAPRVLAGEAHGRPLQEQ
jgi:hypothetical protein